MRKVQTVDAETLLSTPLPPVRWMIPELLPAGLTLLAGASKAGKSWLCLWLCLQLAKGGKLWGRPVQPRPVLYLCLEDTYARIQKRLFQLTEDPVPGRLYFQTSGDPIGRGLEQQLEAFLATHPDTGLVVIDTLQKVRVADQGKGVYATDYQDMAALKSLADQHNIALLLVHHLRKQGAADPFQQISGSNGLMGAADTIWLLQRQRMSPTARLLVTGRDMESRTLHLEYQNCVWNLMEEETADQQLEKEVPQYLWTLADFLEQTGRWQGTATQLMAVAGIEGVQANQFTRKLVEHYYVVLDPRGIRYKSRRTSTTRQMQFWNDDDDGSDDECDIYPDHGYMSKTPSSSSSSSQEALFGNKHGLCVATGQPFAGTGPAPTPRRASVAGQPPEGRLLDQRPNLTKR